MSRNSAVPHYKTPLRHESKQHISKLMEVSTITNDKESIFNSPVLSNKITKTGYNIKVCATSKPFFDKVFQSSIDFSDGTTEKFSWKVSNSFIVLSKLITRECGMHLITRECGLPDLNLMNCLKETRRDNTLSLRTCGEFMLWDIFYCYAHLINGNTEFIVYATDMTASKISDRLKKYASWKPNKEVCHKKLTFLLQGHMHHDLIKAFQKFPFPYPKDMAKDHLAFYNFLTEAKSLQDTYPKSIDSSIELLQQPYQVTPFKAQYLTRSTYPATAFDAFCYCYVQYMEALMDIFLVEECQGIETDQNLGLSLFVAKPD